MNSVHSVEQSQTQFFASRKNSLTTTRISLWLGGVLGLLIPLATGKGGSGALWMVAIPLFGFIGLLDWYLRKQMHIGKALVTVDALGIESPLFSGQQKRYAWSEVTEATFARTQNVPMLQLSLRASATRADKRSFWTGLNPSKPAVPLSALDDASQERLLTAIQQHLRDSRFSGAQQPAVVNQIAEERAFQERLKSFAPTPWLTYGLIAVNVTVWLALLRVGGGMAGTPSDVLLAWGGNAASEVQRGQWWRMASAMFLHSGLMHVALNMLGLYAAGVAVERIYGHRQFALIYLGSGLVGGGLSLHFAAQSAVSVGASGAVFGVTGALLVGLLQHREQLPKSFGKQTFGSLGFFILYSLAQGFTKPGIDNAAHVGGLLAGCILAYLLPKQFDHDTYVRQYKSRAAIGLVLIAGATISLATLAPPAAVDQQGVIAFLHGMRKLGAALHALEDEVQQVKSGKLSEQELDARSRTVFAPMMRDVVADLTHAVLPPADPRRPLLADAKKMAQLLLESFAMESMVKEGSDKPQPVDPVRMEAINAELTSVSARMKTYATSHPSP